MKEVETFPGSEGPELITRIRAGDEAAFRELFFTFCQPLIRFAGRFVNDISLAEDLVQEVFLKIWENRRQLNPELSIKSYLYVAVRNQALKQLRDQRTRRRLDEEKSYIPSWNPTPEDLSESRETEAAVHRVIGQLPEKCRLIFSMNRFDKLTYTEIADILGLSIKTIETQMGRALAHLRKQLHYLWQVMVTF